MTKASSEIKLLSTTDGYTCLRLKLKSRGIEYSAELPISLARPLREYGYGCILDAQSGCGIERYTAGVGLRCDDCGLDLRVAG